MRFCFETTLDGSPTLRIEENDSRSEAMHSLKGAYSETLYIYGAAVRRALELGFSPKILSMGLGLGYVEIMAAALLTKSGATTCAQAEIESFEILPELRENLVSWVEGAKGPPEFSAAYDSILERNAREFDVRPEEIRSTLKGLLAQKQWRVREALETTTLFSTRFGVICFDAFSAKSTPDLWTEEFLVDFLKRAAAPECVLSTYACTGSLKRALKAEGFAVNIRQGFSSKRDSTFAARGGTPIPPEEIAPNA